MQLSARARGFESHRFRHQSLENSMLGKGAYGIHQSGKWYTNENIDQMLLERHMAKKARNAKKKHHLKGPAKRTAEDDQRFEDSLRRLIDSIKSE